MKFQIRDERDNDGNDRRKGNRSRVRRILNELGGKLSDETEPRIREQLQIKTMQIAAAKEQERWNAWRRSIVPQYAYIGEYDEDESDDFVDYEGDPYFDSNDEVEISFEDPGYFEEIETAFETNDRFPVLTRELPLNKRNQSTPVLMNLRDWLDQQVGRPYLEVCDEARAIAGKNWWMVRKQLRLFCTTAGNCPLFYIDEDGKLRHYPLPEHSTYVSVPDKNETWLKNRHVVARGKHLYWYVPCIRTTRSAYRDAQDNTWKWTHADLIYGYRQDKELNDAEMAFFASLEPNAQAEILSRFKSAKELAA
jgi:hypothetical protein